MSKLWLPSGVTRLALCERNDADLYRLAAGGRQAWTGSVKPGFAEQLGEGLSRVLAGADLPPQPLGSPVEVPDWAAGEGVLDEAGFTLVGDVAMIGVEGVLSPRGYYDWWEDSWVGGYRQILNAAAAAVADPRVAGLLFVHDTPGGLVEECDATARLLRQLRDEGGKSFAVWARYSCSAGMYLAAQSDGIFAQRDANVGSIGVRMGYFDWSAWLERMGDRRHEFKSGRLKDMGSPYRPPSKEEAALFQAEIDHLADRFFTEFAAGRGTDVAALRESRGFEAKVFTVGAAETGHDDLDPMADGVDLIDAQMSEQEAFEALRSMAASRNSGASGRAPFGHSNLKTGHDQENEDMKLQAKIAALQARAADGDDAAAEELREIRAQLAQDDATEDTEEASDGGEEESAEGDDVEEDASDDGDEATDESDDAADDDEEDAAASAQAIADLAHKAGKSKFGASLAIRVATGRLSRADAEDLLSAAAREASPVRDALADGRAGAAPAAQAAANADAAGDALSAAHKRVRR